MYTVAWGRNHKFAVVGNLESIKQIMEMFLDSEVTVHDQHGNKLEYNWDTGDIEPIELEVN